MAAPEKQTVIQREGQEWAFHLPEYHTAVLVRAGPSPYVVLSLPGAGGSYRVTRVVDDEAEERRIVLGGVFAGEHGLRADPKIPDSVGYPFPSIEEEVERLKGLYVQLGGIATDVSSWAQSATHDSHTRWLRSEIRRRRRG